MALCRESIPPVDAPRERERLREKRHARETRQEPRLSEDRPYRESPRVVLARALLKVVGLFHRGVENASHPSLRQLSFTFEGLPHAFDGFRILHLSDFHFDDRQDLLSGARALLKGMAVDLCVLTGDYRFNQGAPWRVACGGLAEILNGIQSRHGVLGILGNNDVEAMVPSFREMGIHMLVNEGMLLARDGASIWVAGIDDSHDFRCESIPAALEGAPEGVFSVLLAHAPEVIKAASACGIDLYLCGHTHGGQIALPWWGPFFLNTRCARRYTVGTWRFGAMQGFTTTGLGASTLPVRFHCPPEAAVIELRRAAP